MGLFNPKPKTAMNDYLTPKIAMLSALYFIIALLLILIVDIGLYFFLNNVAFTILDWFNRLGWVWKLILLFFGGYAIFTLILGIASKLPVILGGLIFNKLPLNWFTMISSLAIAILNAIANIIWLWTIPEHYGFWIVCELLLLSGFIWSLSSIVLPLNLKTERSV